tara:strand:- start:312 stop:458 length:147 start_codon:yes stop_codon:yes gene_type:complete
VEDSVEEWLFNWLLMVVRVVAVQVNMALPTLRLIYQVVVGILPQFQQL